MKINYDLASEMQLYLNQQQEDNKNIKIASALDNLNKAASLLEVIKDDVSSEVITKVIESISNKLNRE